MKHAQTSLKLLALASVALAVLLIGARIRRHTVKAESEPRRPVLVELFTSEGCSSCPPADALLARLDRTQFVPGAEAIVLSEHVTYWNSLGWRDPFSLDAMTERQRRYSADFGLNDVYTPQVVVDGAAELVGSDERGLARAVEHAVREPKVELAIQNPQWSGNDLRFQVVGQKDSKANLMAALAEDATQSSVARGENQGRTLKHVAVVRVLEDLGKGAADGRSLSVHLPAGSEASRMRLVVFLADRRDGHVLGAAQTILSK